MDLNIEQLFDVIKDQRKFAKLHPEFLASNQSFALNIKIYTVRIQEFTLKTLIYHPPLMNLNLCDRTSISNVTILDQKDRKNFQFRRLTHKMSNLARRIQKEKAKSKEQRSQFQQILSKFNLMAKNTQQKIEKISSVKDKNPTQTEKSSRTDQNDTRTQLQKTQPLEKNHKHIQDHCNQTKTKQGIKRQNSRERNKQKQKFEKKSQYEVKKSVFGHCQKGIKNCGLELKRAKVINLKELIWALVFSMIICFFVRNSFSYI